MFSTLRQNNEIYVLDKSGTPTLKVGRVLIVKPTQPFYTNPLDSTIEVTINVDGETLEFKQIPSNLSVATLGNVILAETKELMCREVDAMLKNSQSVIDSIPYHQEVITVCDDMLRKLNPQLAKDKEMDERIENLSNKVLGMESKIDKVLELIVKEKP